MNEIKFRQAIYDKDGKFVYFHYWGFFPYGDKGHRYVAPLEQGEGGALPAFPPRRDKNVLQKLASMCGSINGNCRISASHANTEAMKNSEQYVGLLDLNGKEIYEGDIVRAAKHGCDALVAVVVYCAEGNYPAFHLQPDDDCDCNVISYYLGCGEIEIIGNVHENLEILEEAKEGVYRAGCTGAKNSEEKNGGQAIEKQ